MTFAFYRGSVWKRELKNERLEKKEVARHSREHQVDLERRLEKLSLICRAMWTLIQEKANISEKELAQRTVEIDLLDGKADGRVSVPARDCSTCKRTIAPRHDACYYCGSRKLVDSVFENI
jgi:hypothetical protein